MSDINVNISAARSAVSALSIKVGATSILSSSIAAALGRVGLLGATRVASAAALLLSNSNSSVAAIENNVQRLISTVNSSLDAYESTDSELQQKINKQKLRRISGHIIPFWQERYIVGIPTEFTTGFGMFGFTASLAASVLGLESSSKFKSKFSLKDGEASIEASAGLKGYVAKGNVTIQDGLSKTEINAALGEVGVKGKAKGVLFEDGEFNPSLEAEIGAEANALSGSITSQTGTDEFNAHATASGEIGHAEAQANASISKDGFTAGASAEASLFTGEAKAGFSFFGITIDVGVEGKAVSVGGEASCNVTGDSASAKIGGSLGLGLGLSINIDWSKAKSPSWNDIF